MEIKQADKKFFTARLMDWHSVHNDRSLPWKDEKNPYKIWLSEIILQQTRAQQGLPYYLAFTKKYSTIKKLAAAKDEDVFRLWQGLGYYNRCKNLLATARLVTEKYKGGFPKTFEEIIALKGIGPYTAAAIASFAYGLPHAVVDGNVYRVLARFFGIETPTDSTEGKKQFQFLAETLLNRKDISGYNQAIMDLGATICKPQSPLCTNCPLEKKCFAYKNEMIAVLPVKAKKPVVKKRFFHFILLKHKGKIWIRQRDAKDIWQSLHELFLIEANQPLAIKEIMQLKAYREQITSLIKPVLVTVETQKLTHQTIEARFFELKISKRSEIKAADGYWVAAADINKLAFPRLLVSFLEKYFYF